MLVIFGGLPGSGKTTTARALAQAIGAVYVRVDTVEQSMRASGMLRSDVGPAGYMVCYGVAEDNLRLGNIVVADTVNPLTITREAWRSVAERSGAPFAEIEIICSDATEHRRRVETRASDVEGLVKPSWEEVMARRYDDWGQGPLVIDTAVLTVEQSVDAVITKLGLTRRASELAI